MGCFGPVGQTTNGLLGAQYLTNLDLPGWSLGTDGEPMILTAVLFRDLCSITCHANHACQNVNLSSHSVRSRYVATKAASECVLRLSGP